MAEGGDVSQVPMAPSDDTQSAARSYQASHLFPDQGLMDRMRKQAEGRSGSRTPRAIEPPTPMNAHLVRLNQVLDLYYTNISESQDTDHLAFNALPTPQ